jgi:phosphoribosylanthranilate isomerase
MTKIKICGIQTLEDALFAANAGADMLGFNFVRNNPHAIDKEEARTLCIALRDKLGDKCPILIGVFVNELVSNISAVTNFVGLNAAQLNGDESDVMLKELRGTGFKGVQPFNKAMALDDVKYYSKFLTEDEKLPSFVLDPYHKSVPNQETSVEIALAVKAEVPRMMLAGTFTLESLAENIKAIQPWGIDIVEDIALEGKPEHDKIKAFIDAVKSI